MRTTYEKVEKGVPFEVPVRVRTLTRDDGVVRKVNGTEWNFSCCDCGLTHNILIQPGRKKVVIYMWRDNRRTSGRRRWNKYPCRGR